MDKSKSNKSLSDLTYSIKIESIAMNKDNLSQISKEKLYEDAEFDNTDELREFVNEWNEKNHLHSFSETNIAIYVPNDITKEYAKRLH